MRGRSFVVLMFALLLAAPAWAQEQRGSIEGIVKDVQEASIPGAVVEARAAAGGVLTTTTDQTGLYRFPQVLPGVYEVTAKLTGFQTVKVPDVIVSIGSVKKVDFTLKVASVSAEMNVVASSPLVDVKSSARSTTISGARVELLPHGRDYTSLITQAPGANMEAKSAPAGQPGIMIDGASAAENRYVIDGMETSNIIGGLSGKNLIVDFVEEVQVKSTGYAAEYGGSTGGVINVLTKSGTNRFAGQFLEFWQGDKTTGANNQTLRAVFGHADQAEYWTYPEDGFNRYETGGALGGPIMKDKAWFFGAYQPAYTTTNRVVNSTSADPDGSPRVLSSTFHPSSTSNKQQVQYLTANETNQFGNKLRTRIAFNNSWSKTEGLLAAVTGADPASTVYTKGTRFPNWTLSGTADYIVNPNFILGARVGTFVSDTHDFNVNNVVRYIFNGTSNIGMPGVPASEQHDSTYVSVPNNSGTGYDTQTRDFVQVDATYYVHKGGDHQFKGGFQYDHRAENIQSGELQNLVTLTWGQAGPCGFAGTYGCYEVRSAGPSNYKAGFGTVGNVTSNVNGFFFQDTWSASRRLTINAGVRTEQEKIPAYALGAPIADPIQFGFGDKIAPRLGFAYDLKGNGTDKVYASWGRFYDIFKLNMPRGSFGGDKWISYYFTLDNPNFETLLDSPACPPTCPGTAFPSKNFRLPSSTPGLDVENIGTLKPMRSQELSFGYEHQINRLLAGRVRFVHKNLDRAIDDIGDLDGNGDEAYIIANPGEGLVAQYDISGGSSLFLPQVGSFPPNAILRNMPKASRKYNSVEVSLDRQLSNSYMYHISYIWSRDQGNYSGLSSSDENGRDAPNNARDYDYPAMLFNQKGEVIDGVLPTDRTHQLKLGGLYQFHFGTAVGANIYLESGLPVTRQVPISATSAYPIRYLGRESDGRTPMFSQTDLYVQHEFKVGSNRRAQLNLTVTNLFDQRTGVSKVETMRRTGAIPFNDPAYYTETAFYAGQLNFDQLIASAVANGKMTLNPQFLMFNAYQAPIQARIGVKFIF